MATSKLCSTFMLLYIYLFVHTLKKPWNKDQEQLEVRSICPKRHQHSNRPRDWTTNLMVEPQSQHKWTPTWSYINNINMSLHFLSMFVLCLSVLFISSNKNLGIPWCRLVVSDHKYCPIYKVLKKDFVVGW